MKRNLSVFLAVVLLVIALVPTLALAGVKLQPPVITGQIQSQVVQQGDDVWLTVDAYSPDGYDLDGQWYLVISGSDGKQYLPISNHGGSVFYAIINTNDIEIFTYVAKLWCVSDDGVEGVEPSDEIFSDEVTITVVAVGAEKEKASCPTVKSLISNIKNKVEAKVEKVEAIVVSKVSTLKSKISDLLNSSKKNDDKKKEEKKEEEKKEEKKDEPKQEEVIMG